VRAISAQLVPAAAQSKTRIVLKRTMETWFRIPLEAWKYVRLFLCCVVLRRYRPCDRRPIVTEHHAMKAYWGSRSRVPHILDPGTRCRWVVSFTPRSLYSRGKSPWYPLERWLGGAHNQTERGGKDKNSQPLRGLKPPIIWPVAKRYTIQVLPKKRFIGSEVNSDS
jgi:hypothetical protein